MKKFGRQSALFSPGPSEPPIPMLAPPSLDELAVLVQVSFLPWQAIYGKKTMAELMPDTLANTVISLDGPALSPDSKII